MHDDYQWLQTEPILSTLSQFGRYKKLEIVLTSCYVFVVESVSSHSKFKYTKRKSHKRECAGRMEKNNLPVFFTRILRGCLHDTGATFAPQRVHSGSLSWLYICLHDTTTNCHAGASHPGVSSLRLLYRGENFTPVRNLATVSCKRETTTRFVVKSVCQWTGTGSACVMCVILNHTYILLTRSVSSCQWDTKSKSHRGMKLAPVRVFSCEHPLRSQSFKQSWGRDRPR